MAEEPGEGAPSLEPPRLWRRRKPAAQPATAADRSGSVGQVSRSEGALSTDRYADAPVPEAPAAEAPAAEPVPEPTPEAAPEPVAEPTPEPSSRIETPWVPTGAPAERKPRVPRQRPTLPPLDGPVAAGVTGLLVGGWLVLSTFATLHLCSTLRSSSSCGGPGLLLLVVIVIVGVVLGAVLLRLFGVRGSGSMSFLAVALVAVIVMIFFAGSLDRWWTIPIVAVLTVASYLLSHWVTTTYIDPAE